MRDIQHYHTELHAKGFKYTNKFSGFDSCCAHFSTRARVGTMTFQQAKMDAVDYYWNQQKRGWEGYTVGKTYAKTGDEPISVMSPEWEYRTQASMTNPVYQEVK